MVQLKSSGVRIERSQKQPPVAFATPPQHPPVANATHPPITITEDAEGRKTVSARSLYKSMKLTERFSAWIERMFKYGFEAEVDYTPYQTVHPQNGQLYLDYVLSLACAKEIAMLQRTELGKQIRLYLLECERQIEKLAITAKQVVAQNPAQSEQITKLVQLTNKLTNRIIGLEEKLDRTHKAQEKWYETRVVEDNKYPKQPSCNWTPEIKAKRDKAMAAISRKIAVGFGFSWKSWWSAFESYYNIDLSKLSRNEGEHMLDAVVNNGHLDKILEMVNWQS